MPRPTVAGVDFELPPADDQRRTEVRAWLAAHPSPTGRDLAEAGYAAPHWPAPWGRAADPVTQLVIDDELRRAGVRRPENPIGIGWAGPTILQAGTDEQKQRYLLPLLAGEEQWCQLFSEPDAGSDLAGLHTTARRDGEEWVVNGQKIWTSLAQDACFGILLARTGPAVPKRHGITYFICPMDAPGIEIRPIIDMTGVHAFNEVFFDDVRFPVTNVVGAVNDGWRLAKVTLANERVSLSTGGALWGRGPNAFDLVDLVVKAGGVADPHLRQQLAAMWCDAKVLDLIRLRTLSAQVRGREPGPEASIRKLMADEHGQAIMELARDLCGAAGMLQDSGPLGGPADMWSFGFLYSPALTIGGGTSEVQRNIIGERVLGLPAEPAL